MNRAILSSYILERRWVIWVGMTIQAYRGLKDNFLYFLILNG